MKFMNIFKVIIRLIKIFKVIVRLTKIFKVIYHLTTAEQTRNQDLTIIRANEHVHRCSGEHFKIFPLYKVNTERGFLRR
jgi:hypothetical protein